MNKINFRTISSVLSDKQLKNVMGGTIYENPFISCLSREVCGGICYEGLYGSGTCGKYYPSLDSFDWICLCYLG